MRDSARREYFMSVGFGQVPGHRRVVALGHNGDIDITSVPEDLCDMGGLYAWPTSAVAMEVLSSSADDAAAGTGARTVTIAGLDAAYAEVTQVVTLAGTTPVSLPTNLYRVNQLVVSSAGSGETNAGTITLRRVVGGQAQCVISAGYGISRVAAYSVPAGHTLQVVAVVGSINRDPGGQTQYAAVSVMTRTGSVVRAPLELSFSNATPYRHEGLPGIIVPEKADFWLRCVYVSRDNMDLTAGFLGVLKRNDTP